MVYDEEYLREIEWYIDEFKDITNIYDKEVTREEDEDYIVLKIEKQELNNNAYI